MDPVVSQIVTKWTFKVSPNELVKMRDTRVLYSTTYDLFPRQLFCVN